MDGYKHNVTLGSGRKIYEKRADVQKYRFGWLEGFEKHLHLSGGMKQVQLLPSTYQSTQVLLLDGPFGA